MKVPCGRHADFLNFIAHVVITAVLKLSQTKGHICPCLTSRGRQGEFTETSKKLIHHATNLQMQIGSILRINFLERTAFA
jgi:hypothetical protein